MVPPYETDFTIGLTTNMCSIQLPFDGPDTIKTVTGYVANLCSDMYFGVVAG